MAWRGFHTNPTGQKPIEERERGRGGERERERERERKGERREGGTESVSEKVIGFIK